MKGRRTSTLTRFSSSLGRHGCFRIDACYGGKEAGRNRSRQVSDDEADARVQLAGMPFHLGHHAPLLVPASSLIAEAGIEAQYMVRRVETDPV